MGIYQLWNAIAAEGSNCRTFGGEGIGYTCTLPVTIDTRKFYRLRLWRLGNDSDGQWWGGWLIEVSNSDALTEHFIGQIKVPPSYKSVDPGSITNFVEYFGNAVTHCNEVPQSVVGFTPPAINYHGKGTGIYSEYSNYRGSNRASQNHCSSGQENNGAFVTGRQTNFKFANGVMMFLGGTTKTPSLNPSAHPIPRGMPDS